MKNLKRITHMANYADYCSINKKNLYLIENLKFVKKTL